MTFNFSAKDLAYLTGRLDALDDLEAIFPSLAKIED